MKSYLQTGRFETIQTIDSSSGEILDTEVISHKFMTKDKEEFFLIYASLIGLLGELSSGAVKTLSYILLTFKKESQFEIGGASRKLIADKMNISLSNVANALTELKSYGIIYSPYKSIYIINPRYAYQGSTSDRNNAMKAIIEIGCKNC